MVYEVVRVEDGAVDDHHVFQCGVHLVMVLEGGMNSVRWRCFKIKGVVDGIKAKHETRIFQRGLQTRSESESVDTNWKHIHEHIIRKRERGQPVSKHTRIMEEEVPRRSQKKKKRKRKKELVSRS